MALLSLEEERRKGEGMGVRVPNSCGRGMIRARVVSLRKVGARIPDSLPPGDFSGGRAGDGGVRTAWIV